MLEKAHTYIVEVIFEEVRVNEDALPGQERYTYLNSEVFSFSDDNKSAARQNADRFFDKTIRYGLTRSAGSVVKSVIPATSIKNIGIVDLNEFRKEQQALKEPEATLVPAQVEAVAEPAVVNTDVATN